MLSFIADLFPAVYAEEKREDTASAAAEEQEEAAEVPAAEEEEEEPEDIKPTIEEACGETSACAPLKHHLDECTRRVQGEGAHEDCIEELYHFLHCVNECAVPKYFDKLV
ncbi:ubiquinol-cytochrome C reductase hinge domain-containing protein [Gamsiella multidivaricata]|uniref:ubiquinol-cytochrome C reductase hinge domain-containing protein n=1 Tax=Gamsiella multidivaricata TaxID=101098 RepID=UPI00221F82FA|nr:ubiquinol-cytochrome C reductase hinge domain-containing protein [Gamsiella multidivaricata]KAI7815892.1 ubiquinol-cytochrome C reductase hinge domain-containing protein [Gamsiella multidivaricata]